MDLPYKNSLSAMQSQRSYENCATHFLFLKQQIDEQRLLGINPHE